MRNVIPYQYRIYLLRDSNRRIKVADWKAVMKFIRANNYTQDDVIITKEKVVTEKAFY